MRGLVNHEKRNLLAITLVYTIVICFILQYVIANDISGTADQINNFYGGIYNNYGNLFLGTLASDQKRSDFSDKDDHRNDDIYDSMAFSFIRNDHDENKSTVMV